jgi:uncharacterized protein (DUF1501 family)
MLSRRQFGLLAGGAFLPFRRMASAEPSDRKFLFVFNDGGWDTGCVFTPWAEVEGATAEDGAEVAESGGVRFVDHPSRPSVRSFFEAHGARTAVLNGLEVRSITHERCRQLVLKGAAGTDDWPSTLAAGSARDLLLPHVVLDGPAFTDRLTAQVVRIGDEGQLPALLGGSAFTRSDTPVLAPTPLAEARADAYVAARAATSGDLGLAYGASLDRIDRLRAFEGLRLEVEGLGCERDIAADCALAFDLFARGLSRCAMLRYRGVCAEGWDTHANLDKQGQNFEGLFGYLLDALDDLGGRRGTSGGSLADEVTIVVFSEMGREPRVNGFGGRDHWTFTSAMLIGAGVRGGQSIGGLDAAGQGLPIDLASGAIDGSGTALVPEHLGATLLALADLDPSETGVPAIGAVIA